MRPLLPALLLGILSCSFSNGADPAAAAPPPVGLCKDRKDVVAECIKVRGRLRSYAGAPRCRIWPIGTTRLLGVVDPGALPSNVACGDGFEVYADFVVCPVTEAKPSGIQMVCVASAGNLRASEIKREEALSKPESGADHPKSSH